MESVRARDEEARFYAYEQQCLRLKPDTGKWIKLFSYLYERTADFGRSFMRPFLWLLATFGFFSVIYFIVLAEAPGEQVAACLDARTIGFGPCTQVLAGFERATRFGLQQVFQPFAAVRPSTVMPDRAKEVVPLWLASVAAVHSILTLAFVALFLLALRRRFKLE